MLSDRLKTRLEHREALLRLIDRRRTDTSNSNLGRGVEKAILDLEMADLEMAAAIQESKQHTRDRLARYGLTEQEDGTLVTTPTNRSPRIEIRIEAGQVLMRLYRTRYPDSGSNWRPVDRCILLWWFRRDSPIAAWLRTRAYK